jgi:hypothetical protein
MTMHKIRNWSARRSGPTLTVKGTGETGQPVHIAGLDVVTVDGNQVLAVEGPHRAQQSGRREPIRLQLVTPAAEALESIVREMIFGDGTDACLQRTIDLCNEARAKFGIERSVNPQAV